MRKTKLLNLIPFGGCAHEFSWPRRWPDGDYYQVCLLCGAEYRYDWKSMKRTERLPADSSMKLAVAGRRKPTWSPRARRLRVQIELKYRGRGGQWHDGGIQNISQSGVLFDSDEPLAGSDVEMIFEMPQEIAGQPGRKVLCSGTVVRSTAAEERFHYAVSIRYYKFLAHEREPHHHAQSAD